ncbi:pimeloyl-ACP methyl ester carboxylesterase [Rhodoligotrophos appendicifer]|uniref:dienelactone hydrolase family protein n=1 Tax=Rhodoligotrophos appendicifer TaxID=987056 RepID=UPI001FE3877E|nr:alpha/beta fold hydrolase [Rhodoligotrophos appendicifer]
MTGFSKLRWLIFVAACLAAGLGAWRLATATAGLTISHSEVAGTPVTVFAPEGGARAPVVVIAHGFAGSQQLMQPFAITLARSGFVAVTYDLLGHGRNPEALAGNVMREDGATANLVAELGRVADFARGLPGSDGRLAVLGHSMASDIAVRYAIAHPEVGATVAVSMFSPVVTADAPRNLLVIVGSLEAGLRDEALRAVGLGAGGPAQDGVTYGSFADGSARRAVFSDGVEHISVLYARESLAEARDWLIQAFGQTQTGPVEARGLALALFFLGVIVIARFASELLPRLAERPVGCGLAWTRLAAVGVGAAIATPLLLWKAPVDFLPVPVADYLSVHFLVFGLLTGIGLFLVGSGRRFDVLPVAWGKAVGSIAAATGFCLIAIYLPVDLFITSFVPTPLRLPLVVVLTLCLLPYFLADEWLTRGETAPRGAYLFTKFCFVASLAAAIALSPSRLFFLIIITPVILAFFIIFGLISSWIYKRTGHPLVGAVTNAILFAWAISVTFPILAS